MTDQDGEPKYIWTLRQWYAGQAMLGLIGEPTAEHNRNANPSQIATWAFEFADSMIAHEQAEQEPQ